MAPYIKQQPRRFTREVSRPIHRRVETAGVEWNRPHWPEIPLDKIKLVQNLRRFHGVNELCSFTPWNRRRFLWLQPVRSLIVDAEVSHAPDLVEDKNMGDSKRDFEVIDRSSERHQIYLPLFNFSPTRNRPLFLRFPRRGTPLISQLVGPLLNI